MLQWGSSSAFTIISDSTNQKSLSSSASRRDFIGSIATASSSFVLLPNIANANNDDDNTEPPTNNNVYTRFLTGKDSGGIGYTLTLPPSPQTFTPTNKPLQTHLDEINLQSSSTKGYQYSITVDPIRLKSLRDFGTPEEVGAKIVMAELRRDGILDVRMGRDPIEAGNQGAYDVEYISDGKRGKKHFVTRTVVMDGKLVVLTVQVKEEDWGSSTGVADIQQVWDAVASFQVLKK